MSPQFEVCTLSQAVQTGINGEPVEELMEKVYQNLGPLAAAHGRKLSCEIIAWDRLVVAVDADAFQSSLNNLITWMLEKKDLEGVKVRAFPTPDESAVTFAVEPIMHERANAPGNTEHSECNDQIRNLRDSVRRMGGEWECAAESAAITNAVFRLTQWV